MRPGARLKAATEVLQEILAHHRPAATALSDWGRTHRFAGSGDRAAIGNTVYDVLRRKASAAYRMHSDTPRALVLGTLREIGMGVDALAQLCGGDPHELQPLTVEELAQLSSALAEPIPDHIAGNFPEWLTPSLRRTFGDRLVAEASAMATRAPVDIRVNTLKADRGKVMKALSHLHAIETPWSPIGIRLPAPQGDARQPNVEAETAHGKGWYEVQDEGSQLVAALTAVGARHQLLDICAGAGGKALAIAAALGNTGQVFAYDSDKTRLRPIFERLRRAGTRNVQVINAGDNPALAALGARFDVVLVDAPCTGTGTWRRRPDAKWRLKPENIPQRVEEQRAVLAIAADSVKPGGRLVYATCSLLPEENVDQIHAFIDAHPQFALLPWASVWREALPSPPPASADGSEETLMLTPASHGTDGFFIAILTRRME
jgi:16S rRNA (cytosine967-C5)-methyltransferase